MLTREVIGTVLIAMVLGVAVYIFFQIRKRRSHQESVLDAPGQPEPGNHLFHCFYVSTVFSHNPLERVWAYGLGIRGQAELLISSGALTILRRGERGLAIPLEKLTAVTRESATIDRAVEARGLLQLHWSLGSTELITNLRISSDQEGAIAALREALVK